MKLQEVINTAPYIKDIDPYQGTLFDKYLLNKPAIFKRDDGEKVVVYHFIDFNSTEFFPVQVMLHPQRQLRGCYKLSWMKLFHFPRPNQSKYFELMLKNYDPFLSDVDKVDKFKRELIKKGYLNEEDFYKYVEDKMNYQTNIRSIDTVIDFSLYTL